MSEARVHDPCWCTIVGGCLCLCPGCVQWHAGPDDREAFRWCFNQGVVPLPAMVRAAREAIDACAAVPVGRSVEHSVNGFHVLCGCGTTRGILIATTGKGGVLVCPSCDWGDDGEAGPPVESVDRLRDVLD